MRIVFLNAYHLGLRDAIERFIASEASNTDVFCFQEARRDEDIVGRQSLSKFQIVRAEKPRAGGRFYSLATFIRRPIKVIEHQVVSSTDLMTGLGLLVRVQFDGQEIAILNVHGNPHVFNPLDTKRDSSERLRQSKDFLQSVASIRSRVIGGDFNLLPETESLEMFRCAGYRDLIWEYAIPTTRNHLAWDRYPGKELYLFSDYVFTSRDLQIGSFVVPDIVVSDHLPLILEIRYGEAA